MTLKVRLLTEEEETTIEKQVHCRTLPAWNVTRARIIWYAKQRLELCEKTTRLWLRRFNELGMKGLEESPRSGRPRVYSPEQIAVVIQMALTKPDELG